MLTRRTWHEILDRVLRPARPTLERCVGPRERHLVERRSAEERRTRALAACEARINDARAAVFAANDGIVTSHMTDLEREWRRLSRRDPDEGMMDLWARIAPARWLDQKRWRAFAPPARIDGATALASDAGGVEAAEAGVVALRAALATHGTVVGNETRWAVVEHDIESLTPLLGEPLCVATEACAPEHRSTALDRAQSIEREVHTRALERFPARPKLARDLASAAFVDFLWGATTLAASDNPARALHSIWTTGYVVADVDARGVTLGVPPLFGHEPPLSSA